MQAREPRTFKLVEKQGKMKNKTSYCSPAQRIFSPRAVPGLCDTIGRDTIGRCVYLFKRLTAVSACRFYRFEHIVSYSSGKVIAKLSNRCQTDASKFREQLATTILGPKTGLSSCHRNCGATLIRSVVVRRTPVSASNATSWRWKLPRYFSSPWEEPRATDGAEHRTTSPQVPIQSVCRWPWKTMTREA